jgi:NAD(P)-dependent dehydrogenase (short-subunit alcohol dehydrogenase family)
MLTNKVALVTGVSTGIGLATATRYLKEGAKVIGVGDLTDEVKALGDGFDYVACDVTKESDINELHKHVEQTYGVLDILTTICDHEYEGRIGEVDAAEIDQASKHILQAPMLLTKAFTDLLGKSELASVIHDFPIAAFMIEKDYLTSTLNVALADYVRQATAQIRPIRVNGVMFGLIKGHMLSAEKEARFEAAEKPESVIPSQRLGTPTDVANLNNFLADEVSKFFNSALIPVDGGYYTMNARSMGNSF